MLALAGSMALAACDAGAPDGPNPGSGARLVLSDTSGVAWQYGSCDMVDCTTRYTSALFAVQVVTPEGTSLLPDAVTLRSGRHGCRVAYTPGTPTSYGGPGSIVAVRECKPVPEGQFAQPVLEVRVGRTMLTQPLRISTTMRGLGYRLHDENLDVTILQGTSMLLMWRDPKQETLLEPSAGLTYTLVRADDLRIAADAMGLPVLTALRGAEIGPRGSLLMHVRRSDGTPVGAAYVNVIVASAETRFGVVRDRLPLTADWPGDGVTLLRDDGQAFSCVADGNCRPIAPTGTADGTPVASVYDSGRYLTQAGTFASAEPAPPPGTWSDRTALRRVAAFGGSFVLALDGTVWSAAPYARALNPRFGRHHYVPWLQDIAAVVVTDDRSFYGIPGTYAIGFDRRIHAWAAMDAKLNVIGSLPEVPTEIVGAHHAAAVLLPSGAVWAWGDAAAGWLADPAMTTGWRGPARIAGLPVDIVRLHRHDGPDGSSRVVVHTSSGKAWMWGRGVPGCGTPGVCHTPTRAPEFDGVVAVYAGRALLADGSVKPTSLPSKRLFTWPSAWRLRVAP